MYEIIKAVAAAVASALTLFTSYSCLKKKQYQESWWFLALTAINVFATQP